MQLRDDNALSTVNYKSTLVRHIRYGTKIDILNDRIKILMIGIGTVQFQLCLQGYAIGQTMLQTLFNSIAGRVNVIVQKFQNKVVSSVRYRKVLREHLVETFVLAFLWRGVQLKEILE